MDYQKIVIAAEVFKKGKNINLELKDKVESFSNELLYLLLDSNTKIISSISLLENNFVEILSFCYDSTNNRACKLWESFLLKLPGIFEKINKDAVSFMEKDPAANSLKEVVLAYPGFYAIVLYRVGHEFLKLRIPLLPRLITEYSHGLTGIDIHPGAKIGDSFFIDHGTGIVIGETAIIKDNVCFFQGITLGGLHVNRAQKNKKRHPTIESNVTIYANATILGGKTIIGRNSIIGGNTWVTSSIEPNSIVTNNYQINKKKISNSTTIDSNSSKLVTFKAESLKI